MDLGFDHLYRQDDAVIIALSHYYRHPSGDLIPDPDMEIRAYPEQRRAEALTYQDAYVYQCVYETQGDKTYVRPQLKKQLNTFLNQWLKNCIDQGHRLTTKES